MTEQQRIRGRAWQVIRSRILRANPLCVACQRAGKLVAATVVDHIVALYNGGTNADDNMQSLCKPCHERKTRDDLNQRIRHGCDASGMPTDAAHHWNG